MPESKTIERCHLRSRRSVGHQPILARCSRYSSTVVTCSQVVSLRSYQQPGAIILNPAQVERSAPVIPCWPVQGNSLFQGTQLREELESSSGSFCEIRPRCRVPFRFALLAEFQSGKQVTHFLPPGVRRVRSSVFSTPADPAARSPGRSFAWRLMESEDRRSWLVFHGEVAQGSQVSTFDVRGRSRGASAAAHTQSSCLNDLHNRQKSCINFF